MMGSWTKKSTPDLAKETHSVFRGMYFNGFLAPTLAIHPTFTTMATQCQVGNGKIGFNNEVLDGENDTAFGVATAMMFATIVTMDEFFKLQKPEVVAEAAERFSAFEKAHLFAPVGA